MSEREKKIIVGCVYQFTARVQINVVSSVRVFRDSEKSGLANQQQLTEHHHQLDPFYNAGEYYMLFYYDISCNKRKDM